MIKISSDQMNAMSEAKVNFFIRRLSRFLLTRCAIRSEFYATALRNGENFEAMVVKIVRRAMNHNIFTEIGLAEFAIVEICYAKDFDAIPRVMQILHDGSKNADENMNVVIQMVIKAESRNHGKS